MILFLGYRVLNYVQGVGEEKTMKVLKTPDLLKFSKNMQNLCANPGSVSEGNVFRIYSRHRQGGGGSRL